MKKIILSFALVSGLVASAVLSDGQALAGQTVHPDCVDNPHPTVCTKTVETILSETQDLRDAFNGGDLDEMASFYAPPAVVTGFEQFYRGHDSYRYDFLPSLFPSVMYSVDFDFTDSRLQVVSPDVVIQYGYALGTTALSDGSTGTLTERFLQVWTRNPGDHERPFLITAAYYEVL
jgi:ketosteroid isomerase-like protein